MPQASMSLSTIGTPADLNNDDTVNAKDLCMFTDLRLKIYVPLAEDINRDGVINLLDFALLTDDWLWG